MITASRRMGFLFAGLAILAAWSRAEEAKAHRTVEPQTTEMVFIPAGEFVMGTSEDEARQLARQYAVHPSLILLEAPQRKVNVKAFWIDRFPVTNRQFLEFARATGHAVPAQWAAWKIPPGLEDHPVVDLPLEWAEAYAKWSGKRLPTADEWEKAARGTDGRLYPWGSEWKESAVQARPSQSFMPAWQGISYTVPVGCFPDGASPYGVMDMAGNVPEYTATLAAPGQDHHVIKGASAACSQQGFFRCASVAFNDIGYARRGKGFRCAKDAAGPPPDPAALAPLPRRTVPPMPQPRAPRDDLYLKEPITLVGGPTIALPYLPDGHVNLLAPEGVELKVGEPDDWRSLLHFPYQSSGWKVSADRRKTACELTFPDHQFFLRVLLVAGMDYVDYKLTAKNLSTHLTHRLRINTCQSCGSLPYFYDQEDGRTFIFTDAGPKRLIECPPFSVQCPLYRSWPILPAGAAGAPGTVPARVPLVCTVSTDGRWVMAVGGSPASQGIFRNANYSCLHLNPTWPALAPGEEQTRLVRYYFLRGGVDEALARWKKDAAQFEHVPPSGEEAAFADVNLRATTTVTAATCLPPRQPLDKAREVFHVDLSRVVNRALADEQDNDGKGGWSDQGADCDLRTFQTGKRAFGGVPFDILPAPKSLVALISSWRHPGNLPEQVTIPVGRKADALFFLHATAWMASDESEAFRYVIRYRDGKTETVPVIGGRNMDDWADPYPVQRFGAEERTFTTVAATVPSKQFKQGSVYRMEWSAPRERSGVEIESIAFIGNGTCVPMLLGITGVAGR